MVEVVSQLDLSKLVEHKREKKLTPSKNTLPLIRRPHEVFILVLILISIISALIKISNTDSLIYLVLSIVIFYIYFRNLKIDGIYLAKENGLRIPYTWLSQKKIPWKDIISSEIIEVTDDDKHSTSQLLRIELDTTLVRFNTTGLIAPYLFLSSKTYNEADLRFFNQDIADYKGKSSKPPNTLAQRLNDQVDRAWKYRNRIAILNIFDAFTEAFYLIMILEILLNLLVPNNLWYPIGGILLGIYLLILGFMQILERPRAIVGIRAKEFGALSYNEAEMVTEVHFMAIIFPYTIQFKSFEFLHTSDNITQIDRVKQIEPENIEPGILTHVTTQIMGNHGKADGVKIQFNYVEREHEDILYEIPIYWN